MSNTEAQRVAKRLVARLTWIAVDHLHGGGLDVDRAN